MATDISFGSIVIFDKPSNGSWKRVTQEKIKYGIHECSEKTGILISGISAETFYATNNVDISNILTVGNSVIVSNNLIINGDVSGNISNGITNEQFTDISNNYNEKKTIFNNNISSNKILYSNLENRFSNALNRTTQLMNIATAKHGYY